MDSIYILSFVCIFCIVSLNIEIKYSGYNNRSSPPYLVIDHIKNTGNCPPTFGTNSAENHSIITFRFWILACHWSSAKGGNTRFCALHYLRSKKLMISQKAHFAFLFLCWMRSDASRRRGDEEVAFRITIPVLTNSPWSIHSCLHSFVRSCRFTFILMRRIRRISRIKMPIGKVTTTRHSFKWWLSRQKNNVSLPDMQKVRILLTHAQSHSALTFRWAR